MHLRPHSSPQPLQKPTAVASLNAGQHKEHTFLFFLLNRTCVLTSVVTSADIMTSHMVYNHITSYAYLHR